MRYVFRGLKFDGSGWVYGYLTKVLGCLSIYSDIDGKGYRVKPETVSIWTGRWAKENTRVFAGDIIEFTNKGGFIKGSGIVVEDICGWLVETDVKTECCEYKVKKDLRECFNIVVVGNIHERGDNGN